MILSRLQLHQPSVAILTQLRHLDAVVGRTLVRAHRPHFRLRLVAAYFRSFDAVERRVDADEVSGWTSHFEGWHASDVEALTS